MQETVVMMIMVVIMMQDGDAYDKCRDWSEFLIFSVLLMFIAIYTILIIAYSYRAEPNSS